MEKKPEVPMRDLPADEQALTPEEAETAQGGVFGDGSVRFRTDGTLPAVQKVSPSAQILPYIEQDN
jgi:hypothetical protein